MSRLHRWYQWIDNLSLDIVGGAIFSAYYFSRLAKIEVSPISFFILGLAVWIIYTVDHLKDASRTKDNAATMRHQFHQQNFKILYVLVVLSGLVSIILIFNLDKHTILWGLKLATAVLLYLIISHYLSYTKELMGGTLYCLGILLPTISQMEEPLEFMMRTEVLLFALLVIANLLLFSSNELQKDIVDNHKSFASRFGKSATVIIVKLLLVIIAITLLLNWSRMEWFSVIIFIMMLVMLSLVAALPPLFEKNDRYRFWGDLIFLFPVIVFFV